MSHELSIELILDAPKEALFRCWAEPKLLAQWFAPKPMTVTVEAHEFRAGGTSRIVMHSPDGQAFPNDGVFLEVVPHQRLVTTDAFTSAWQPKEGGPFMTATVTFEDAGAGKTKYRAVAKHWTAEAKAQHEKMGFHEGWTICARQLEALAKSLSPRGEGQGRG